MYFHLILTKPCEGRRTILIRIWEKWRFIKVKSFAQSHSAGKEWIWGRIQFCPTLKPRLLRIQGTKCGLTQYFFLKFIHIPTLSLNQGVGIFHTALKTKTENPSPYTALIEDSGTRLPLLVSRGNHTIYFWFPFQYFAFFGVGETPPN